MPPEKPVYGARNKHYTSPPPHQRTDTTKDFPVPVEFHPSTCKNYFYNEMTYKNARVEDLFNLVATPSLWPDYYPFASNVKFAESGLPGDGKPLKAGAQFVWTTFGFEFAVSVKEFVPNRRIRWQGRPNNHMLKNCGDGTHFWTFYDLGNGYVKIVTEESQVGTLPFLGNTMNPHQCTDCHQDWLIALRRRLNLESVEEE